MRQSKNFKMNHWSRGRERKSISEEIKNVAFSTSFIRLVHLVHRYLNAISWLELNTAPPFIHRLLREVFWWKEEPTGDLKGGWSNMLPYPVLSLDLDSFQLLSGAEKSCFSGLPLVVSWHVFSSMPLKLLDGSSFFIYGKLLESSNFIPPCATRNTREHLKKEKKRDTSMSGGRSWPIHWLVEPSHQPTNRWILVWLRFLSSSVGAAMSIKWAYLSSLIHWHIR